MIFCDRVETHSALLNAYSWVSENILCLLNDIFSSETLKNIDSVGYFFTIANHVTSDDFSEILWHNDSSGFKPDNTR